MCLQQWMDQNSWRGFSDHSIENSNFSLLKALFIPTSLFYFLPSDIFLDLFSWFTYDPVPHLRFPGGSDSKVSARNAGDPGLIPRSERSPGEGNGNLLQYSCLKNSMDGGAWWATVHGVAKSGDTTERLFTHSLTPSFEWKLHEGEDASGIFTAVSPRLWGAWYGVCTQ